MQVFFLYNSRFFAEYVVIKSRTRECRKHSQAAYRALDNPKEVPTSMWNRLLLKPPVPNNCETYSATNCVTSSYYSHFIHIMVPVWKVLKQIAVL